MLNRQTDVLYANSIKKKNNAIIDYENERNLEKQKVKKDYIVSLNEQIKTEKQRKKYDILMTEHERRVHDKTIKAYEQYENDYQNQGVAKLGQNYQAIQHKYIGRAFGAQEKRFSLPNLTEVNNLSQNSPNRPTVTDLQRGGTEIKRQPSQLAIAGNMNLLGLSEAKIASAQQINDQTLRKVMENMEKEKSLQFRSNTGNRGYGFQ